MTLMPAQILATQFPIIIHFDSDHASSMDTTFLFVHHDSYWLFPKANDPLAIMIITHCHMAFLSKISCIYSILIIV